ncbi:MAG: LLM class F420-dependent oxidoreductase [SAR202 cluster bacterium]|jgi:probable F420-dependent oxidoreductase|nr:LLM class F420-dependent oxidoreductase [SAR202 cluster bacterium]MDP6513467.1 LLM class F420-dependent oxidoreductase [SAR202 cluster bacterium]MDP6714742.1 LLM class F420-dependent oxidoreductase [SAR202 cluster bacterium]
MNIGISMSATPGLTDFAAVAQKIEELGFDSVWLPEHPVIPVNHNTKYAGSPDGSIPIPMTLGVNPLIALATAASATTNLGLGTAVNLITEHNPIDLAKQISTLDFYSGGRFMFGIGTGWFREESEIMGADFDHRWSQAREYVLTMKELWTEEEAEYHGEYVDFPPVIMNPKPARKPHPPVYLGGNAKNVLRRVVRYGEGWLPNAVNPDDIKAARVTLAELCDSADRDPDTIGITIHSQPADRDLINRFEEAGAERVLMRVTALDQNNVLNELEELAGAVFN